METYSKDAQIDILKKTIQINKLQNELKKTKETLKKEKELNKKKLSDLKENYETKQIDDAFEIYNKLSKIVLDLISVRARLGGYLSHQPKIHPKRQTLIDLINNICKCSENIVNQVYPILHLSIFAQPPKKKEIEKAENNNPIMG